MKIIHISDLHLERGFSISDLPLFFNKRGIGFLNLFLRRRKHYASSFKVVEAIADFIKKESIDLVLCTGDYTALGTKKEFEVIAPFIKKTLFLNSDLFSVYGNHDFYLKDSRFLFQNSFSDFLEEFKENPMEWPIQREINSNLLLVGINSVKPNPNVLDSSGRIDSDELIRLEAILKENKGKWIFILTHYAPFKENGEFDSKKHGLQNASDLLAIIRKHKNVILLHGHIHRRFYLSPKEKGVFIFGAGSSTQKNEEGFWYFNLEENEIRVQESYLKDDAFLLNNDEIKIKKHQ